MFIVLLKFSANRHRASQFMDGHKRWIERGFEDRVFLLSGSLEPEAGGCILAANASREDLERRIGEDPFVAEDIVSAEIQEFEPAKANERLAFLVP